MNSENDVLIIEQAIAQLRKDYGALRHTIEKDQPHIRNIVFYHILQARYPEFSYSVDDKNRITSNLHCFKFNGKIPSLSTMLLNGNFVRLTEPEVRYGTTEVLRKYGRLIEFLFDRASLIYPDPNTFFRFLTLLDKTATLDSKVHLVSAICPDYSYSTDEDGTVRYTFKELGSMPGLAGKKTH